jgi:pyruvate dehydrogenase E2 component (dihydrolipoamide acetyltransferase)
VLEEGEDSSALGQVLAATQAATAPAASSVSQALLAPSSPQSQVTRQAQPADQSAHRIKASPLARRIAAQRGVDLRSILGTGPGGRIVRKDVENASGQRASSHDTSIRLAPSGSGLLPSAPLPPRAGLYPASHFYLTIDVEIDRVLQLRKELLKMIDPQKVSLNDFVIRALALALSRVPEANAMWEEQTIRQFQSVDVSVAVAIEGGLVTPIIRDAQAKSVMTIAQEMKGLAERARAGKLKPEEFQGGTVTLSNLGMFGVRQFEAIINPPQACILSVGASEERAVVRANRHIDVATVMTCTLSADHRVVDGAVGARLMAELKTLIQEPLRLLL